VGTGKSTLANALADALGAELLQTDVLRTELLGENGNEARYGEGRYSPELRGSVYGELFRRTRRLLSERLSVVLDGTFLTAHSRSDATSLAEQLGAVPLIVDCECPAEIAKQRIAQRLATGASQSQARPDLFDAQQQEQEPNPVGLVSLAVDSTGSLVLQVTAVLRQLSHELMNTHRFARS